jgi:hypothetical protein
MIAEVEAAIPRAFVRTRISVDNQVQAKAAALPKIVSSSTNPAAERLPVNHGTEQR